MEYLLIAQGGRGQAFVYEYDAKLAGSVAEFAGASRVQSGGMAEGSRGHGRAVSIAPDSVFGDSGENSTLKVA